MVRLVWFTNVPRIFKGAHHKFYYLLSSHFIVFLDVPDDILGQLKWLKDGLDAMHKWKDEVTK